MLWPFFKLYISLIAYEKQMKVLIFLCATVITKTFFAAWLAGKTVCHKNVKTISNNI